MTDQVRIARARATLTTRADRCVRRAGRARIGSNERTQFVQAARFFSACASEIDRDPTLREAIARTGWNRGWRSLGEQISAYVRGRDKEPLND